MVLYHILFYLFDISDINDCTPTTCSNGGECVDQVDSYICLCADGYTGDQCDIDIDDCESNPCINIVTNGCSDRVNNFTCTCLPGYEGDTCGVG